MSELDIQDAFSEIQEFFLQPNAFRSVLILIFAIVTAYIASKFLARTIIYVAQWVALHSDKTSSEERFVKLRQVETYLSVTVAIVRAMTVAIVAYVTWQFLSPMASNSAAAIGAGAFFIVFAGQTLGMLLRDLTAGAAMIIEGWFNVGDFIKIEPFIDVTGVVERFTLRSTKLRSLNGEIVWIHNQQIQAVHVAPRGVRTIAIDLFVKDVEVGTKHVRKLMNTIPQGPTLLAKPMHMAKPEEWSESLWRITVTGETAPGREWLLEQFFVNAIKDVDEGKDKDDRIFIYEPIARYADPVVDQKFKRAVRAGRR